jgi:hypothetical protein
VTGGEDQPQQLVADVVVQGGVQIGHGLLLGLQVPGDQLVLALEHAAAAQMIQRPVLGGRHQPGAGPFRDAGRGPPLGGCRARRPTREAADTCKHPVLWPGGR